MKTYYIGLDVHCNSTEIAVEHRKKIVKRYQVATTVDAIVGVLEEVGGRQHVALEEGPMAHWLYRNLTNKVHRLLVCDPRRNALIARDGDKDDPIDAGKLAALLRGGFLREVYHSDHDDRVELKRWVELYHDRVREATRTINRLRAQGRMYGIRLPAKMIKDAAYRQVWLDQLTERHLAGRLAAIGIGLDVAREQARRAKRQVLALTREHKILRYWQALPGIGEIRAVTFLVYVDTPFRFRRKNKLWKYCGVGLVREASGTDRHGKPKPARLKLEKHCNRRLKNVVMGAAISATHQKMNPFRAKYEQLIAGGQTASNARHTVARDLATVMWGMWKSDSQYGKN